MSYAPQDKPTPFPAELVLTLAIATGVIAFTDGKPETVPGSHLLFAESQSNVCPSVGAAVLVSTSERSSIEPTTEASPGNHLL